MDDLQIRAPGGFVPGMAISFGGVGSGATAVDGDNPLPVAARSSQAAAASAALAGTSSASATLGPFVPELGRAIWVTLSGDWAGTVTAKRSTDGGVTRVPLTYLDGSAKGVWTANVNAPIGEESVAGAIWSLDFQRSGGTLAYRMEQ